MRRVPEKMAGWVAEYCPICRDVQAMALKRIGTWDMRRQGTDFAAVDCTECGQRYQADPAVYLAVAAERPESVKELMLRTQPRLPIRVLERVRWDCRAIRGDLPGPERAEAIRDPILRLAMLAPRRVRLEIPAITAPVFFATYVLLLTLGAWTGLVGPNSPPWPYLIALVPSVGAAALVMHRVLRRRDVRVYRREIEPRLARALRPLRPEVEELRELQAWMKATANPLARYVEPEQLLEAVRAQADRSMTNVDSMNLPSMAAAMWAELAEGEGEAIAA